MTTAFNEWMAENARTYFTNATAMRDFRVQMRGSRSVVLLTLYLASLLILAYVVYSNVGTGVRFSVVDAQQKLRNFYETVMYSLAFMVSVVPVTMAATSIIAEKQRQSLDLVFSAPVTAKYYMVGKLIGAYRYVWMILVLSLPVTAACVVLGGASWSDVLASFFMMSMHGLVLASLGLGASLTCKNPVQAIMLALLITVAYCGVTSAMGATMVAMRSFGGPTTNEASAFACLSPYLVTQTVNTFSIVAGYQIPNWLLSGAICLLATKFVLAVSGFQLSPYSVRAAAIVKAHILIYAVALPVIVVATNGAKLGLRTTAGATVGVEVGVSTAWYVALMSLCVPVACFALEGESRLRPNGLFAWRRMFDGTPAGILPFFLLLTTVIYAAVYLSVGIYAHQWVDAQVWWFYLFSCAMWVFGWGAARLSSAFSKTLANAQGFTIAILFIAFGATGILINSIIDWMRQDSGVYDSSLWWAHPLKPLGMFEGGNQWASMFYTIGLTLVGVSLARIGETLLKRKLNRPPVQVKQRAA